MDYSSCMGAITSVPPVRDIADHRVSGREDCRLASSSKDTTIKVWDTIQHRPIFTLSGHTAAVTCLRWGGKNWIYSGSQDKSIRIWDAKDVCLPLKPSDVKGKLLHVLSAHAHWVNTMSVSTDFVIRTGAYDHTGKVPVTFEESTKKALERYRKARRSAGGGVERLISGSDDFTMFLWEPEKGTKPVARLSGSFSPPTDTNCRTSKADKPRLFLTRWTIHSLRVIR
jgi:ribosome assembly protein 4